MVIRSLILFAALTAPVLAADDADARARAALALAVAKQSQPAVVGERPARTPEQAAKAAIAEAMGKACDCGLCDKAKPMPPATASKDAPKRTVEKLTYAELTKAVAKLAPGESLRVYVGQKPVDSATGRIIELTDKIPGEKQIVGVWRCWSEKGEGKMQSLHPDDKPTRVIIAGRYYDRHADGSLFWCVECNGG